VCSVYFEQVVRNSFKILGYHERDDTTQKSTGKAKFTLQKGTHQEVWEASTLGGKSTEVLSDAMLSLSCPWIGQVLGSQCLAN
jgi:hypothetical protein